MKDNDNKMRFNACQSLFNIIKCLREVCLKQLNEIFKTIINISGDSDQDIKRVLQILDSLLKDIVNEAAVNPVHFDLNGFMKEFKEKLKVRNSLIRQILISWLDFLD